jgi:hypothetical protein
MDPAKVSIEEQVTEIHPLIPRSELKTSGYGQAHEPASP